MVLHFWTGLLRRLTVGGLMAALFLSVPTGSAARDIYVAVGGTAAPGTADGSAAQPYASVGVALDAGTTGTDRVILKKGRHGPLALKARGDLGGLTITAAPGGGVHVDDILLWKTGNVTISGFQIWPLSYPVKYHPLVQTSTGSQNVHFSDLDVRAGPEATKYLSWSKRDWLARKLDGARLGSADNTLTNSRFTGTRFAVTALAPRARVENNLIDGFSGDGIRGLGDDGLFFNNTVRNCVKVDGNHDDGFQSWAGIPKNKSAPRRPVRGLVLERNVFEEWTGPAKHPLRCVLQGIGMFDGPYDDVTIRNNLVVVTAYHGITVMGLRGGQITNNTMANPLVVQGRTPWLSVQPSKGGMPSVRVHVANNIAASYRLGMKDSASVTNQNQIASRPAQIFRDPANGDYRIKSGNPAASAADPQYIPSTDLLGQIRPQGAGGDLGAYETR